MRFVARYGRFGIQLRPHIAEAYATGMAKTIQEPIYANFSPDILGPVDREVAMATWGEWPGSYQEMDEVTAVPPDYRIGVFDTDLETFAQAWDVETKLWVEEQLVDYATRYNYIAIVPKTLVAPPWPNYDAFKGSVPALMRKLVDEGHDLNEVLAYEHAVQGRGKITQAIEELLADPEALGALEPETEEVTA